MSEWISVDDHLPESTKTVLITTLDMGEGGSCIAIGRRNYGFWFHGTNPVFDVTHWQPLPEPPEDAK